MNTGLTNTDAAKHPRILFKPGSWLAKIEFINHLVLFNNVLITLLADKQGGKTTFSHLLQNNLDPQIKFLAMTATASCTKKSILEDIANHFKLDYTENMQLKNLIAQINERSAHVLIIFDDAHNIPEEFVAEAMEAIKNQGDFGFFHLCLLTKPSILGMLQNLSAKSKNDLIHTIELSSLNENETRTYVLQRAMAANLITKPLTEQQCKQFYQITKGNLSKVNSKLEPFIFNCAHQKRVEKWNVIKSLMLSSLTVAVIAAGLYWKFDVASGNYLQDHPNDSELMHRAESAHPQEGFPAKLTSSIPYWKKGAIMTEVIPFDFPQSIEESSALSLASDVKDSLLPDAVLFSSIQSIPFKETSKIAQLKTIQTPPVIQPKHPPAPKVAQAKNKALQKTAQIKKTVKNTSDKLAQHFTIQLLASHKIKVIEQFKKGKTQLAHSKTRYVKNNQDAWYILTLGEFHSKNQAMLKIKNLPPELTKLNPWIRPVANAKIIG